MGYHTLAYCGMLRAFKGRYKVREALGVAWQRLLPSYAAREVKGGTCRCVLPIADQVFILSQPDLTAEPRA